MSCKGLLIAILCWLITFGITNDGSYALSSTLFFVVFCISKRSIHKSLNRNRYNDESFKEERLNNIETLMKTPKNIEMTDYEERIRRNLLLTSFVALIFTLLGLQIDPTSRFLGGLTFSNIKPEMIHAILLCIVCYEFVHYVWNIRNTLMHWRIRLTGINHIEVRGDSGGSMGMENEQQDYLGKDEDSNLYTWMFETRRERIAVFNLIKDNSEKLKDAIEGVNFDVASAAVNKLNEIDQKLNSLNQSVDRITNSIENVRVDASLLRFDQWFKLLISSQNRKWLIMDLILPILLGSLAITTLVNSLCNNPLTF